MQFAKVILNNCILDYECPDDLAIKPFQRVVVPLRNTEVVGIVYQLSSSTEVRLDKVKSITRVIDGEPIISEQLGSLLKWIGSYYKISLSELYVLALPKSYFTNQDFKDMPQAALYCLNRNHHDQPPFHKLSGAQKKCLNILTHLPENRLSLRECSDYRISVKTIKSLESLGYLHAEEPSHFSKRMYNAHPLNEEQLHAFSLINSCQNFKTFLLYGVTGSGKTEIYCQVIQNIVQHNGQVLVLVPEIHLTIPLKAYFQNRFAVSIEIIHSNLSTQTQAYIWSSVQQGICQIIIATRKGIFLDIPNLKMIIVDEEHDQSFKNNFKFSYNAKHIAIKRAQINDIPIVLGSATPSADSYYLALKGTYKLLTIQNRALNKSSNIINIVDTSKEKTIFNISSTILEHIRQTLEEKNQVILYYNRVGFANVLECTGCGLCLMCDKCDNWLTLITHPESYLICRVCNQKTELSTTCVSCNSKIISKGLGTERLERDIKLLLPHSKVLRMDSFTKTSFLNYFEQIKNREVDIIIGTQIIAKGYDFTHVGFVGIINTDMGLTTKDWASFEASCQLINQVAGRAGRAGQVGKVYLQTRNPARHIFHLLMNQDYSSVLSYILSQRKRDHLPPFVKQIYIYGSHYKQKLCFDTMQDLRHSISRRLDMMPENDINLSDVQSCLQEKINNLYRYYIAIKSTDVKSLHSLVVNHYHSKIIDIYIDIDPVAGS